MTKRDAIAYFEEQIMPIVLDKYGDNDHIAMREAFNDFTDGLCKDGLITDHQYNTWSNPY